MPKYFSHIDSSVCCTGGMTLEIAMPRMPRGSMPRVRNSVSTKSPYSSAVCSRRLVSRQDTSRRSPSYTPIFVLVLPTSRTSSILRLLDHLARGHALAAARALEHEGAVQIEVDGHAGDAVDADPPADGVGEGEPARAHRSHALAFQPAAPLVERLEQRAQD